MNTSSENKNRLYSENNNRVYVCGKVIGDPVYSHEIFGEGFYEMPLEIKRLSGQGDILPITISERLMGNGIEIGETMCFLGQFRSYNKMEEGKSRLRLTVFVREVLPESVSDNPNSIVLSGYICKPPIYRKTPFNREIADILIAVNRSYNKSDYIPAIAWGRNARFVRNLAVGDRIALSGRIQSREYQKKISDETSVTKTAYEVSISKLAAYGDDEEFDIDKEFDLYASPVRGADSEREEGANEAAPERAAADSLSERSEPASAADGLK